MQNEQIQLLGEIKGKLDLVIDSQAEDRKNRTLERAEVISRLDSMDTRLRKVEVKAALSGAVTGGLVAIGFEVFKAKLSALLGGG